MHADVVILSPIARVCGNWLKARRECQVSTPSESLLRYQPSLDVYFQTKQTQLGYTIRT